MDGENFLQQHLPEKINMIRFLILEDSDADAALIEEEIFTTGLNCEILVVSEEASFIKALNEFNPSIVLSDFRLPSYDGFRALEEVRSRDQEIPFIFISGIIGENMAIEALKRGATDFVNKEYLNKLQSVICRAMNEHEERRQRRRAEEALERIRRRNVVILDSADEGIVGLDTAMHFIFINRSALIMLGYDMIDLLGEPLDLIMEGRALIPDDRMTLTVRVNEFYLASGMSLFRLKRGDGTVFPAEFSVCSVKNDGSGLSCVITFRDVTNRLKAEQELSSSYKRMRKIMFESIHAMATALEFRDPYTAGHQKRVADLSREIAKTMNLEEDAIEGLYLAGLVHDIGKICVPAEILTKPAKLTVFEFNIMKEHAEAGYQILKNIEFPWPIAETVYRHHERLNGSGYPGKLAGSNILLEARILAVADTVEAMASHRPYRPSLGLEKALEEIKKNSGILYDPKVVDACLYLFIDQHYQLAP